MSDPRNVAHDKKVKQEKEHQNPAAAADARTKKRRGTKAAIAPEQKEAGETTEAVKVEQAPGEFEKSSAVFSKLKEMEFHSRANIETLAALTLTIEEELKQKEFSEPINALYSAQDGFQTKIAALIERYQAKCDGLRPSA